MKKMFAVLLATFALMLPFGSALALDANAASKAELEAINGIGPAIAERIVAERKRGKFKSMDELRDRVSGIGDENIRSMSGSGLTVNGRGASGAPARKAASPTRAKPAVKEVSKRSGDTAAGDKAAKSSKAAKKADGVKAEKKQFKADKKAKPAATDKKAKADKPAKAAAAAKKPKADKKAKESKKSKKDKSDKKSN